MSMSRPARTSAAREKQLINLAVELAEKQLKEGTASVNVITHFLKMGSERERLERERLVKEMDLMVAKKESFETSKRLEQLYTDAMAAMRTYRSSSDTDYD